MPHGEVSRIHSSFSPSACSSLYPYKIVLSGESSGKSFTWSPLVPLPAQLLRASLSTPTTPPEVCVLSDAPLLAGHPLGAVPERIFPSSPRRPSSFNQIESTNFPWSWYPLLPLQGHRRVKALTAKAMDRIGSPVQESGLGSDNYSLLPP